MEFSKIQEEILYALDNSNNNEMTRTELCTLLKTPWTTTYDNLAKLQRIGLIFKSSVQQKRGRPKTYWRKTKERVEVRVKEINIDWEDELYRYEEILQINNLDFEYQIITAMRHIKKEEFSLFDILRQFKLAGSLLFPLPEVMKKVFYRIKKCLNILEKGNQITKERKPFLILKSGELIKDSRTYYKIANLKYPTQKEVIEEINFPEGYIYKRKGLNYSGYKTAKDVLITLNDFRYIRPPYRILRFCVYCNKTSESFVIANNSNQDMLFQCIKCKQQNFILKE